MIPPEAPEDGNIAAEGTAPPAVLLRVQTLTRRADFQRATRSTHVAKPGFILQMRRRREDENPDASIIRNGFTCSKKVGNAVARNRAKRRLREVARLGLSVHGQPGNDYVLVGRKEATACLSFAQLQLDFLHALNILHGTKK